MARKLKKHTASSKKPVASAPAAITATESVKVTSSNSTPALASMDRFAYVVSDLKRIAVVLGTILVAYIVIYLGNSTFHWF